MSVDTPLPAGDLARRLVERRFALGMTRAAVADKAEMAVSFLAYLESSAAATPGPVALRRLALALQTTPEALAGATATRPPGRGQAGAHPRLETLTSDECLQHLRQGGVGRIVLLGARGPVAFPVNFVYVQGHVVFRAQSGSTLVLSLPTTVGFEVDSIDEAMSEGWSVLVTGAAHRVLDDRLKASARDARLEAWAGADRDVDVAIQTDLITGRWIRQELDAVSVPENHQAGVVGH